MHVRTEQGIASHPELSLIIPAYNEAAHLAEVVTEIVSVLSNAGFTFEIRIVNNGSTDATDDVIGALARRHPQVVGITLAENRQYGGGILAGLDGARGAVRGWIHADGQADPRDIVRLYRKMQEEGRELGKAVRMKRDETFWRKFQGAIYFAIFQLLFWTPYRDANASPKLMTQRAAQKLHLDSQDWFLDPEFVIKACRYAIPITEIETVWRSRRGGATRAHLLTGLEFLKNMLLYRFGLK